MDGILPAPKAVGGCQYERVDERKQSYMCNRPTAWMWTPNADTVVQICASCKRWLETLDSLGLNKS